MWLCNRGPAAVSRPFSVAQTIARTGSIFLVLFSPKNCFTLVPPSVSQICAVSRLSKKYDLATFRQQCLQLLKNEFPTSLVKFDEISPSWTNLSVPKGTKIAEVCIPIINLARELGLYSILPVPSAFYLLIHSREGMQKDNLMKLDDEQDQLAYLKAYIKIVRYYTKTPSKWLNPKSGILWDGCTTQLKCGSERKETLVALLPDSDSDFVASILDTWNEEWEENMCRSCAVKAKEVYEAARQDCWQELPSYFGLDNWETLQKMDFE
ncbi:BTB domain-containing protein [Mycena indigotica]|uniref:BTB domain-containing protein n=1 Tax=Mycena indigotica TaxID=2126181 RepID=A0A8H6SI18_9AGAR|nr:BTB domain-containing protein [Mycena indigotica]KAF7299333.1 BTB domain-containing protein [Mycena indigotica]